MQAVLEFGQDIQAVLKRVKAAVFRARRQGLNRQLAREKLEGEFGGMNRQFALSHALKVVSSLLVLFRGYSPWISAPLTVLAKPSFENHFLH